MPIDIRPLQESDLPEAERIFRLAFGTFIGMPDPMLFAAGADCIGTRWRAPACNTAWGAYDGNTLVGSNVVVNWGSFGFFGPLTVLPAYWGKRVAQRLLDATMDTFTRWGTPHTGLFTFPDSPKHLALYGKHDFWPQHLTALMARQVTATSHTVCAFEGSRTELIAQAKALTETLYPGLDLSAEINALLDQNLGEIVTVCEGSTLVAFAVCHLGTGSEAGPDTAYLKFAAARSGNSAHFNSLLSACEAVTARRGMHVLMAGVNTACHAAYRTLLQRSFRSQLIGVALQRKNQTGYLRSEALVLGDWR